MARPPRPPRPFAPTTRPPAPAAGGTPTPATPTPTPSAMPVLTVPAATTGGTPPPPVVPPMPLRTTPTPPTPATRGNRWAPWAIAGVLALLALVVVGGITMRMFSRNATPSASAGGPAIPSAPTPGGVAFINGQPIPMPGGTGLVIINQNQATAGSSAPPVQTLSFPGSGGNSPWAQLYRANPGTSPPPVTVP